MICADPKSVSVFQIQKDNRNSEFQGTEDASSLGLKIFFSVSWSNLFFWNNPDISTGLGKKLAKNEMSGVLGHLYAHRLIWAEASPGSMRDE